MSGHGVGQALSLSGHGVRQALSLSGQAHDEGQAESLSYTDTPLETCLVCSSVLDPSLRINTGSFTRRDGSAMPVEFTSSTIFREDGVREGVVVTFRDITERLAVEKMKSEFVSTVSHELRTPLTSIRGALGLLAAGLLGNIAPKARRMLDIAINNTDRLVRLINDILDLERMESGRVELHRKLTDANELMRQASDVMQAMADRAGITLTVEPHHEMVWGDPDRIVQLLTNLLSNALKFSPPGSTVRLSASTEEQQIVFSVADRGRGIPADKIDMIFERFKQVDASDSRDKGGTGLGLAICRSIAVAHAGRIWVDSREGEGSVFQMAIPLPAAPPSEPTVLLCDNTTVGKMLERRGMGTVYARSAAELCRRAAATSPDAVMFDLEARHDDDGWRIVERLKSCEATRELPIIVAAMEQPESVEEHTKLISGWVPRRAASREPRILIVEDDLDLARIMTTSFESNGIETVHAVNGREAIDGVVANRPDLIVLDLILPELDGFAVVDWLKKSNSLAHIPLIVYSALELDAAEQARLRLGPTEFLIKSRVSLEEFEEEVVRLLNLVTTETEVDGAA
ncbi:MAG TPA: ATP-binding protein [Thermoanaerobaculia bacterium]|nr:ATP-binding protein [Thermoanaerobaculia bacterium]